MARSPSGLVDTARSSRSPLRSKFLPGPAIFTFSVGAVSSVIVGWALWRIPAVAWYGNKASDQLDAARTQPMTAG